MRMCEPELSLDNVWHVMDVLEGSPAESAGLVPYGDYIVGWSGGVLSAENDFYELVESVCVQLHICVHVDSNNNNITACRKASSSICLLS